MRSRLVVSSGFVAVSDDGVRIRHACGRAGEGEGWLDDGLPIVGGIRLSRHGQDRDPSGAEHRARHRSDSVLLEWMP